MTTARTRTARRLLGLLVCAWLLVGVLADAWAADVVVVPRDGALVGGVFREVQLSAVDDDGRVVEVAPGVTVRDGEAVLLGDVAPGVFRFAVRAPAGREAAEVIVQVGEARLTRTLPVRGVRGAPFTVEAATFDARESVLRAVVRGADLPPPELVVATTSEGRVRGITRAGDTLVVEIETDGQPFPRRVLVGVRELSAPADVGPAWGVLSLRARVDVPVETEPGVSISVEVGGRTYGPVVVGESRKVALTIDQDADDTSARVRVRDPLGNEVVRTIPLTTSADARLAALVSSPRFASRAPPVVYVRSVLPTLRRWTGGPLVCRAASFGDLPVTPDAGGWIVGVPVTLPSGTWDLRVRCELGERSAVTFTVAFAPDVPVAMTARVWPELLSTDFPVSDVAVSLLDVAGDRLPMRGDLSVTADLGLIELGGADGAVVRGEYRGDLAAEVGEDTVRVAWRAAVGTGAVASLAAVGGEAVGGEADVLVRALDTRLRPLPGREVVVVLGGVGHAATTGPDGWARVRVPWGAAARWAVLDVHSERVWRQLLVVPQASPTAGPGRPDLGLEVPVRVDPGRAAEIDLRVEPARLRSGPRAEATVTARLLDRSGGTATTQQPSLVASAGELIPRGQSADRGWVWSLVPPPGFRPRTITVIARADDLDLESEARVEVRPQQYDRWLSIGGGVHTNAARLHAPIASLDVDFRIRVGPRDQDVLPGRLQLAARIGVAWYGTRLAASDPRGDGGTLRMDLLPIQVGLGVRYPWPTQSLHLFLGAAVAPFIGASTYAGADLARGVGVLPPGFIATLGYAFRIPSGELGFEVRGSALNSPGSDIAFAGQVGGVSAQLVYRIGL